VGKTRTASLTFLLLTAPHFTPQQLGALGSNSNSNSKEEEEEEEEEREVEGMKKDVRWVTWEREHGAMSLMGLFTFAPSRCTGPKQEGRVSPAPLQWVCGKERTTSSKSTRTCVFGQTGTLI